MLHALPKVQIFVRFALRWSVVELRPYFGKVHRITLNDLNWHLQGQTYQHACYIHPWEQNFHPFCSTKSRFWVAGQFSEKWISVWYDIWKRSSSCRYIVFQYFFCSMGTSFQDTGRFSKLPYLGMKISHWQTSQKLHNYFLSTRGVRNWASFHSMSSGFRDTGRCLNLPC